jgi:hypothetical protein
MRNGRSSAAFLPLGRIGFTSYAIFEKVALSWFAPPK